MKPHFSALLLFLSFTAFAQQTNPITDSMATDEKKLTITVDIVSRYIWRGQGWGGNFPAFQPSVNYAITDKWSIGAWATTNFKKDYFYRDGVTPNKGYQEVDLGVSYAPKDFLTIEIWDYYWPAFQKMEGVDRDYFNYGPDGVKTVEAALLFDFSEYRYRFNATVSTFVAGNDYRYDDNGENPKQNFTTYIEAGYTFEDVLAGISKKTFKDISISPTIGAVLNNQAEYYTSGDYDRVSFVNLALVASREFDLGKGLTMPLALSFIHNAAKANVERRDFLTVSVSFSY
jgi:hypothetical protein